MSTNHWYCLYLHDLICSKPSPNPKKTVVCNFRTESERKEDNSCDHLILASPSSKATDFWINISAQHRSSFHSMNIIPWFLSPLSLSSPSAASFFRSFHLFHFHLGIGTAKNHASFSSLHDSAWWQH